MSQHIRSFLIHWNYNFPADRWWRQKYSIPLFSERHLEMSQIDIMMEYYEDKLYQELIEKREQQQQIVQQYEEHGIIHKKQILSQEREDELFMSMNVSSFNKEEEK